MRSANLLAMGFLAAVSFSLNACKQGSGSETESAHSESKKITYKLVNTMGGEACKAFVNMNGQEVPLATDTPIADPKKCGVTVTYKWVNTMGGEACKAFAPDGGIMATDTPIADPKKCGVTVTYKWVNTMGGAACKAFAPDGGIAATDTPAADPKKCND